MSRQRMDADAAETLAGVVRLLRRAAELVWAAVDVEGAGSARQLLGLGIDLAADEARNLLPDAISVDGPVPVVDEPAGLLRSAEQLLRRVTTREPGPGCMSCGRRWPTWCGRRTPVSVADPRTVADLLANSDELARESLLDATPDQAPTMVRSWNQLVGSAAELWTVLPWAPDSPSGVGSNGAVAGCRGRDRPQCHRRTLARAGTDRPTTDTDRRQPFPRVASDRSVRPFPASVRGTQRDRPARGLMWYLGNGG